jgi:hypothetical protein
MKIARLTEWHYLPVYYLPPIGIIPLSRSKYDHINALNVSLNYFYAYRAFLGNGIYENIKSCRC